VVRGLLREHGFPVPVGGRTVVTRVSTIVADATVALPDLLRLTLSLVIEEIRALEARVAEIDQRPTHFAVKIAAAFQARYVRVNRSVLPSGSST